MRGSPIRTPSDQRSVGSSPRLIAASHVLHRLLVPRHPPCALNNSATQKPHPHPPPTTTPEGNGDRRRIRAGLQETLIQSQKMLASTVQFSTTNQPSPHTTPPDPAPRTGHDRYEDRETLDKTTHPHPPPGDRGPFPQDPTACLPPPARPPPPFPTPTRHEHRTRGRTRSRRTPAAELVSVPPSSTTPHTRHQPRTGPAIQVQARLCTDQEQPGR